MTAEKWVYPRQDRRRIEVGDHVQCFDVENTKGVVIGAIVGEAEAYKPGPRYIAVASLDDKDAGLIFDIEDHFVLIEKKPDQFLVDPILIDPIIKEK